MTTTTPRTATSAHPAYDPPATRDVDLADASIRAADWGTRVPHIQVAEPVYLVGNVMPSIESMPCRLRV